MKKDTKIDYPHVASGLVIAAAFIGLMALIFSTQVQAQSSQTYGKCVTIPAGQENRYLLGGRDEFYDGLRWTFDWDYDSQDRGRLHVEMKLKDEYGGGWFTSMNYRTIRPGAADSFGDRNINDSGGKVTGHLGTNNSLQLTVNVPHRVKFSTAATQSSLDHTGCS